MTCDIYASRAFKKWFGRQIKKQKIVSNLPVDELARGIIVVDPKTYGFGAFDASGRFVKSSRQVRKNNGQFVPRLPREIPYIDADAIYFGNVYPQFGHFLLEHMNRAWGALRDEYRGAKIVLINNKQLPKVPEYMFEFVRLLGIKRKDVLVLDHAAQFRRVIIPHQGFNLPVMSSDEFATAFQRIRENTTGGGEFQKIYMSRDKLGERRTYGERHVQRIFEKNGFTVLYPETMPLAQQIAAVKNCRVLAGCAGTALHLALFMPRGGTVIQLRRNCQKKCNAPTQHLINQTMGHDGVFIDASVEEMPTDHGSFAPQIIGVTDQLRRFFDDRGFKYSARDVAMPARELAEYHTMLAKWCAEHGGAGVDRAKHRFVRISSCFIPGRVNRSRYRRWVKARLGIQ